MLIFLALSLPFLQFFFHFCFWMKNLIYNRTPKSLKLSTGKWLQIAPDTGEGYALFDPVDEQEMGRILIDAQEHWIYDGSTLTVSESEEIADAIKSHQPEMAALLRTVEDKD